MLLCASGTEERYSHSLALLDHHLSSPDKSSHPKKENTGTMEKTTHIQRTCSSKADLHAFANIQSCFWPKLAIAVFSYITIKCVKKYNGALFLLLISLCSLFYYLFVFLPLVIPLPLIAISLCSKYSTQLKIPKTTTSLS